MIVRSLLVLLAGFSAAARGDDDIAALKKQLESGSPKDRVAAAETLGDLEKAARPALGKLLELAAEDKEPRVRATACEALGKLRLDPDRSIPVLIAACGDRGELSETALEPPVVGDVAGPALRQFKTKPNPLLRKMLTGDDRQRYFEASMAIDRLGPLAAELTDTLIPLMADADQKRRISAINGVIKIGKPAKAAVPGLTKQLDNEDFHTRYWACRGLAAMGEHSLSAVDKLIELTANDVSSVSRNAAMTLGDIGPKGGQKVVDALIKGLKPGNFFLQEQSVVALGKLTPLSKPAQGEIERLLEDPNFRVRSEAARTLWRMEPGNKTAPAVLLGELKQGNQPQESISVLGDLAAEMKIVDQVAVALKSDNGFVRQCAADALALIGNDAAAHLPLLKTVAREDPDEEVRAAAADAAAQIGAKR